MKKSKLILLYIALLSVMILLGACDSEGGDTSDNASDGNTAYSDSVESSRSNSSYTSSGSGTLGSDIDEGISAISSNVGDAISDVGDVLDPSDND